jgi:hypothetical protein
MNLVPCTLTESQHNLFMLKVTSNNIFNETSLNKTETKTKHKNRSNQLVNNGSNNSNKSTTKSMEINLIRIQKLTLIFLNRNHKRKNKIR